MRNVVITLLGILPAFFLVLNVVFSDVGDPAELYWAVVLIGVVYLAFGALAGFWTGSWRSGLWLATPAVLIIALYSLAESQRLVLHAAVVSAALGPACLGANIGERFKRRRGGKI